MNQLGFFNLHTHQQQLDFMSATQLNKIESPIQNGWFSIGIHPEDSNEISPDTLQNLTIIAKNKHCVAIGEIGLDQRFSNLEVQLFNYSKQLELAQSLNLPIILHCVNLWDKCKQLHHRFAPMQPLIYHGFNKPAILEKVLGYGPAFVSIGASVLTNTALQEKIALIPLDRLFLETDASEVKIDAVYQKVAELKNVPLSTLIEHISNNVNTHILP